MKILGQHPGIKVDGSRRAVPRHVETPVVHDVVEVDADAEAVRRLDQPQQVGFRPVEGGDGALLVLAAEVERVENVVADRKAATGFGRRRNPDGIVPGLGEFRHLRGDFVPGRVEILQHRLRPGGAAATKRCNENHYNKQKRRERAARLHEGCAGRGANEGVRLGGLQGYIMSPQGFKGKTCLSVATIFRIRTAQQVTHRRSGRSFSVDPLIVSRLALTAKKASIIPL